LIYAGCLRMNRVIPILGLLLIIVGIFLRLRKSGEKTMKQTQSREKGLEIAVAQQPSPSPRGLHRELRLSPNVKSVSRETQLAPPLQRAAGSSKPLVPEPRDNQGDQAPASLPSMIAQKQRRSERILLRVPVQVEGTDTEGRLFTEKTFTSVVNRNGAAINMRCSLRPDDQVTVTNLLTQKSCSFRVCDFSKNHPGDMAEWGVECLEPNRNFWGIYFPEKVEEPSVQQTIGAMLECAACHFRETVELTLEQYRKLGNVAVLTRECSRCGTATDWKYGFEEAEDLFQASQESQAVVSSKPTGIENRREERINLKLSVRIRHEDGRIENTITEDVSKSGLCCASNLKMKIGDAVFLTLKPEEEISEEQTPARIVWRRTISEQERSLYGIMLEGANTVLTNVINDFGVT
jgi:hypothetical protein